MSLTFLRPRSHSHLRRRIDHCRPHVESLEDRALLSVDLYGFELLKTVGEPAPGDAGFFVNNFQPSGINNRGQVAVGGLLGTTSNPVTAFGEGVFLLSKHQERLLARAGDPAPGGGTFSTGFLGQTAINDSGDVAIPFILDPFSFPIGVNSGLYRYSSISQTVDPVVIPEVTPAPGSVEPFAGVSFGTDLNNRRQLAFSGIVPSDDGVHVPGEVYTGLGTGSYLADRRGHISRIAGPGDPAPGGGTFDLASDANINDRGDVAFVGHVAGDCVSFVPQEIITNCVNSSVYVKKDFTVHAIAEAGDMAPGGGVFHGLFSPYINDRGDVAFMADLDPDAFPSVTGVYLHRGGRIVPIAKPGDAMPGGGTFVSGSTLGCCQVAVNNRGQVAFTGVLNPGDGSTESGLYVSWNGQMILVAKTGTEIPGVGTIEQLSTAGAVLPDVPIGFTPDAGAYLNDHGQLVFGATLSDGRKVLLVATPGIRGLFDMFIPRAAVAGVEPVADAVNDHGFRGSRTELKANESRNRAWSAVARRVDHRMLDSQDVDPVFQSAWHEDDAGWKGDRPDEIGLDLD